MVNLKNLSVESYEVLKENLFNNLSENFELCKTKEMVEVEDGTKELQLNHLLVNLILLRPFVEFQRSISVVDILDCTDMTAKKFNNRLQYITENFYTNENKNKLSECISSIIEDMNYLTMLFNPLMGQSIDLYSIAKVATRNEEFNDLIHTKVDVDTQTFDEIENYIQDRFERALEIIKQEENEMCFSEYIRCGEGLNLKQLRQYMINVGLKPSLNGDVHPLAVNANLLTGFDNYSDYYFDSKGGQLGYVA